MIQENPRILLNIWDSLSQKTFGSSEEEKEVMIITIVEYCKSGMNIDSNSYF